MKKILFTTTLLLALYSCGENIVFVENARISEEYIEYKELNDEIIAYSNRKDSISNSFQQEVLQFNTLSANLLESKRDEMSRNLVEKSKFLQQQLGLEELEVQKTIQKKLDSINPVVKAFIAEYAKAKNYTFIINKKGNDHFFYGDSKKDITTEIIKALNDNYENSK